MKNEISSFEKPILKVMNLTKRFGNGCEFCLNENTKVLIKNYCPHCGTVYACKDISFKLHSGEILGVVGESGSGKSTMLESLYFDQEVTSGEAYISSYKNGEINIFNESSQAKRFLKIMY